MRLMGVSDCASLLFALYPAPVRPLPSANWIPRTVGPTLRQSPEQTANHTMRFVSSPALLASKRMAHALVSISGILTSVALCCLHIPAQADDVLAPPIEPRLIRFLIDSGSPEVGVVTDAQLLAWATKNGLYRYELVETEPTVDSFLKTRTNTRLPSLADSILEINGLKLSDPLKDWRQSPLNKAILTSNEPLSLTFQASKSAITRSTTTAIPSANSRTPGSQERNLPGETELPVASRVSRGPGEAPIDLAPSAVLLPFGVARTLASDPAAISDIPIVSYKRLSSSDNPEILSLLPPQARSKILDNKAQIFVSDSMALTTTRRRIVQIRLTQSEIDSLKQISQGVRLEEMQGTMSVTLAAKKPSTTPKALTKGDEAILRQVFSKSVLDNNLKKPLLIVVDDSWPNRSAFRTATQFLIDVSNDLWKNQLPITAGSPESPLDTYSRLKSTEDPGVPEGYTCPNLEDCPTHAMRVLQALQPYIDASKSANGELPVDIVFIPLTRAQPIAHDFLGVLWTLDYALREDPTKPKQAWFWDSRKIVTMQMLREDFLAVVPKTLNEEQTTFETAQGVLRAVLTVAERIAKTRKRQVFVSASWSTTDNVEVPRLGNTNVLLVAAAGRCKTTDCDKFVDEVEPGRNFARFSPDNDLLIVMQVDENGKTTCNSSRVRQEHAVVAYFGDIEGDCGTSFSTPRVAWLLASREIKHPTPATKGTTWVRAIVKRVLPPGSREKCLVETDFGCIALPPLAAFFGSPKP